MSSIEALQAELNEAVALLKAERAAVARLSTQLAAERNKFEKVVSQMNEDETIQARRRALDASSAAPITRTFQPLNRAAPGVEKVGKNVLSDTTTINNYRFSVEIHEEPEQFLGALLGDQTKLGKTLFQKVVEEDVVYWSFILAGSTKCCDLLLRMQVEKQGRVETIVRVASVEAVELKAPFPTSPHSTATKQLRLLLKEGTIALQSLPLGQTLFTFVALVGVGEVVAASPSPLSNTSAAKDLFCQLGEMFYERFKKEDVIDDRMKQDFIQNKIPSAPPLTVAEDELLAKANDMISEISSRAQRMAAHDTVEKFFHRDRATAALWGMSVARMDVAAVSLFADHWLLNTFEHRGENKSSSILEVWADLDGTRGVQYCRSLSLPGFQDRLFEVWMTWKATVNADGKKNYVIAVTPIENYTGTRYRVTGAKKLYSALSEGVYMFREHTENTCEFTRAQHIDLNIARLPTRLLDFLAKQQLGRANKLHEKFRRNGEEVDRERASALARVMMALRGKPLLEDQRACFERCMALLGDGDETNWKAMESPYPDVVMKMRYFEPLRGERNIATGKAVGVADCSAHMVAARLMDYRSNERMRISKLEGNPARLELRKRARVNENTFATVKKMPLFLNNREFVIRQIWRSEPGKVIIVFESAPDEVDYGAKLRTTRASTRAIWLIEDLPLVNDNGLAQCRLTFAQHVDPRGIIPPRVMDKKLTRQLSVVQQAIDAFRQDEKIDVADREEVSALMEERWREEVYSECELHLIDEGKATLKAIMGSSYLKVLESGDPLVTLKAAHLEGDKLVTGIAESVVDGHMEELAAFEWLKMSREATKNFHKKGGINIFIKEVNGHSFYYLNQRDLHVPGFKNREWRSVAIWKKEGENKMLVCYKDTDALDEEYPRDPHVVAASIHTIWEYERLPEVEGIPQTKVNILVRADVAGSVPSFVMNRLAKNFGHALIIMRRKFDKSLEIDASRRAGIAQMIGRKDESGGAEALAHFEELVEDKLGWERPSRSFGLSDSKVCVDVIGHRTWGKTALNVRTSLEEVAAFIWDFGSRANTELSSDVERTFTEEKKRGGFEKVVCRCQKMERALGPNRKFSSLMTLTRCSSNTIIIQLTPTDDIDGARTTGRGSLFGENFVKGRETVAIKLKKKDSRRTKLEYVAEIDFGSFIRRKASKDFIERRLGEMADMSIYFQRLVPLTGLSADDGKALGHDLLWKASSSSKKRVERLRQVFERSTALTEMKENLPWIETMMGAAIEGKLTMRKVVGTKLVCVSEEEAAQIGRNLIPALKSRKLIEAGVDCWRVQNPAIRELMERHEWFEPMTFVLGKGIVKSAAWGLFWRVFLGSVLSITDLATDLFVLKQFWDGGAETSLYRNAQLASLSTSIALQVTIVLVQNRKKGVARILRESLKALIGLKAPWDAYHVAMGAEQEIDTQFDPFLELQFGKIIELFAESIPGIVIQSSAILSSLNRGGSIGTTAFLSLLSSTLTTGFISASFSYDMDTDPKRRAYNAEFYGLVPDAPSKRTALFGILMLFSSFQILIKGLLVVILAFIKTEYLWGYIVGDLIIYLTVRLMQNDLRYWVPIDGFIGLFLSVLIRTAVKVVYDFTGCVFLRHPQEIGGLFYSVNLFLPLIGLLLLLNFGSDGIFQPSILDMAKRISVVLGSCLCILGASFYMLIKKEYRRSFYSVETGPQATRRRFVEGDDLMKADALKKHKSYWAPIHDEVAGWCQEGWNKWEEEQPEWFTDRWIKKVPAYMKPRKKAETILIHSAGGGGDIKINVDGGSDNVSGSVDGRGNGRRRSSLFGKREPKIAPEGIGEDEGGEIFDETKFKREVIRRRSVEIKI